MATFDWSAQHDDKVVVNCFCKTTASARLWLYLKRLYFISSAITYCISMYSSFYAGLSCLIKELMSTDTNDKQMFSANVSSTRLTVELLLFFSLFVFFCLDVPLILFHYHIARPITSLVFLCQKLQLV